MTHGLRPGSGNYWRRTKSRLVSTSLIFKEAGAEWIKDNVLRLSAAVSFYAVLSMAPLLVIVIRVMGIANAKGYARDQISQLATNLMGKQAADAIKPVIESNSNHGVNHFAVLISTIVLLFSATGVFIELQNSMDSIWDIEVKAHRKRQLEHAVISFIRARLLSLTMVFGLGFVLVFSIFISAVIAPFQHRIAELQQWPAYLGGVAISGAVEFALFCVMFKFLPTVQPKWRNVWHGALIAAILFTAGRFGLAIYFNYARKSDIYGTAGSLVVVLTWIYYSSFSLFFGAEFTKVWTRQHLQRQTTR